jgi:thiol-disulfide isomerase/thioredoxin
MLKAGFPFFLLFAATISMAQTDSIPLYMQFPNVPPFSIMQAPDSTKFSKEDLTKNKPTLIIMFSPDCDHCKHETTELLRNIELFKHWQIIMVAHLDYNLIKQFYTKFNIADYPNIVIGRDGAYFLGTFYKIETYPTMFLYNRKGKFVKKFEGSVPAKTISETL